MNKKNLPAADQADLTIETVETSPFTFGPDAGQTTTARTLSFTPVLNALANSRAVELVNIVNTRADLKDLATTMLTGQDPQDLVDLISKVFENDVIKADSACLDGASDDELDRMLESRRSDRSKTKAKNPASSMALCLKYIGSMYAELIIRAKTGKPYSSNLTTEYSDPSDKDAITRRIKSLQSKQSRLKALAKYDTKASDELNAVVNEIARLNGLRGVSTVRTTDVVKSENLDALRNALTLIDPESLDAESLAKYEALVTKVG